MNGASGVLDGFMILFLCTGLLVVGLSVPMILRRVKPNPWYGFRTAKTLADERVWYEANAYSGFLLLVAGIVWVVAAVALRYVPAIGSDLLTYSVVYSLILLIGLLGVTVLSFRYLRSL